METSLKVESWPIERPVPYAKNPRKISAKAVGKVAASIKEFGFRQPIVVDEKDVVLVGHTRLLAAGQLGLEEVPVHRAEGLTAAQAKAYRLADNRTNEEAIWDLNLLGGEIHDLAGFDLSLTGFDPTELSQIRGAREGLTDEDEAPELPGAPVSRKGDVWRCDGHRILCGDATQPDDIAKVLSGTKPLLMVTDPPYGVGYDPDWRNRAARANGKSYGATAVGTVPNDNRHDWSGAWALFPGQVAYVWHAGKYAGQLQASLSKAGFIIRNQIIWAKPRFVIGRGAYHWQHEPCWYAIRKAKNANWHGDRGQSTLWTVSHQKSETGHSAQKPVEIMRRPIVNHTDQRDAVYDPFLGSGTTMIAAETVGRVCYGIEIDEAYVDVAVKRWRNFTGQEATLEENGQTFEQSEKARRKAA